MYSKDTILNENINIRSNFDKDKSDSNNKKNSSNKDNGNFDGEKEGSDDMNSGTTVYINGDDNENETKNISMK
jgi:hypothetical protein